MGVDLWLDYPEKKKRKSWREKLKNALASSGGYQPKITPSKRVPMPPKDEADDIRVNADITKFREQNKKIREEIPRAAANVSQYRVKAVQGTSLGPAMEKTAAGGFAKPITLTSTTSIFMPGSGDATYFGVDYAWDATDEYREFLRWKENQKKPEPDPPPLVKRHRLIDVE